MISGHDERGPVPTASHFVERGHDLADDRVGTVESIEVAAIVVGVSKLVGVAEAEEEKARVLLCQVMKSDRGGVAIGPKIILARPRAGQRSSIEQIARLEIEPKARSAHSVRSPG